MEPCEIGTLYLTLLPKAQCGVRNAIKGFSSDDLKEIAHDIVVDFIYFSNTVKGCLDPNTGGYFDPAKGSLINYFSGYVWKKCRGIRERRYRSDTVNLEDVPLRKLSMSHDFTWWVEFGSEVKLLRQKLAPFTVSGINLGELFVANLVLSVFDDGERFSELSNMFGVSRVRIKNAVKAMQGKVKLYGPSHLDRFLFRRNIQGSSQEKGYYNTSDRGSSNEREVSQELDS